MLVCKGRYLEEEANLCSIRNDLITQRENETFLYTRPGLMAAQKSSRAHMARLEPQAAGI